MEQRRKRIIETKIEEKKRLRKKKKSTGHERDNLEDTKSFHGRGGFWSARQRESKKENTMKVARDQPIFRYTGSMAQSRDGSIF